MKQSMQDLTNNIEELIKFKMDEQEYPEHECKKLIKQQKIVIGACLNILFVEIKKELIDCIQEAHNRVYKKEV